MIGYVILACWVVCRTASVVWQFVAGSSPPRACTLIAKAGLVSLYVSLCCTKTFSEGPEYFSKEQGRGNP